ncbi:MAG: nucleotide exchange factor GrpE [Acidobacteriia bacterium]|nr:nucleotide exchange factor GrpE [Terriglobia bacterium]
MAPGNGKADGDAPSLDIEHELPPAEDTETEAASITGAQQEECERLRQERDTLLDRLARLQAEFDNFRKRNAREQQEFREYALAEAIKSLLPVVDSFDRALATPERNSEEFHQGLELINRQLHDALAKLGVQPIEARGEPFDPNLHQAVQMVETGEAPDHHVLDELQRGYKLKDRLLRPAMVRVATNPGRK